jgi:hypothetical protein
MCTKRKVAILIFCFCILNHKLDQCRMHHEHGVELTPSSEGCASTEINTEGSFVARTYSSRKESFVDSNAS